MFKYLVLCTGLLLALPSYGTEFVYVPGTEGVACDNQARFPVISPLPNQSAQTGVMTLLITGVQLRASADDPRLTGLKSEGDRFDCPKIAGFSQIGNLYANLTQVGTLKITRTSWYDGNYFDIGNGLAMKIVAGDNQGQQQTPNSTTRQIETYREVNARGVKQIGLAIQATLKVVGKVEKTTQTVQIGVFDYTLYDRQSTPRTQTALVPVFVTVTVDQAQLRSCTLADESRSLDLSPAFKHQLDAGAEVEANILTIGPLVCEPGIDVKASFFDHHSAGGTNNYLRTVYSDNLDLSQYSLKLEPVGGGNPLNFVPKDQLQESWGATVNESTIPFSQATTAGQNSIVKKDYTVKYVKMGVGGDDRAGKIKGIMTVQFLYH